MKNLIKFENNSLFRLFTQSIVCLLLLYIVYFAVWTIFFTETANGDNVEHIHATWLIAQGKIPYRDFFQHHNPLLWYLFVPMIKMTTNVLFILDSAHAIGLVTGFATFFVVYKICIRFFATPLATLLSLLTLCPPYFYIFCFNFNPDTFMALAFAIGLYQLFIYFENQKLSSLVFSFGFFFISFLFTQKILTVLGLLGLISLYVFYKKNVSLTHILYALLLPFMGLCLFVVYLYSRDALRFYWLSNYIFNIRMQDYYGNFKINVVDYHLLIFSSITALISIFCFIKSANLNFKIMAILFIAELLQRCFYFSISPYYLLPLMIFSVCLNSVFWNKISQKHFIFVYLAIAVAIFYTSISHTNYLQTRGDDRRFARYIAKHVTPCDYIINSFLGNQSILNKDVHYYWSLLGHVDIAGEEIGIAPKPDIDKLAQIYKPKLIYDGIYWNNYYLNRGQYVWVQQISTDTIHKYYEKAPFGFYILRKEFQGKNCRYDSEKKEWLYEN